MEHSLDDLYWMFKNNHGPGFGQFNLRNIQDFTPCDSSTASEILDYGINNGLIKQGLTIEYYFHAQHRIYGKLNIK